jgi:hypothetical protein
MPNEASASDHFVRIIMPNKIFVGCATRTIVGAKYVWHDLTPRLAHMCSFTCLNIIR